MSYFVTHVSPCVVTKTGNNHKPPQTTNKRPQTITNHLQTTTNDNKPPQTTSNRPQMTTNNKKMATNNHQTEINYLLHICTSSTPAHQTKNLTFCFFFLHPVITRSTLILKNIAFSAKYTGRGDSNQLGGVRQRRQVLYTNRQSIKIVIQRGVGQLSMTNHSWVIKVFVKSVAPFLDKINTQI